MIGFALEFLIVLLVFGWLYRRQLHDREKARRVPPSQLHLDLATRRRRFQ